MSPEIYQQMAQLENVHWWFTARRTILRRILQSLPLPAAPQLLEIGCGTGGNIAMLREFGAVTAIEMENFAREHAQKFNDCRVLPGHLPHDLPELPPVDLACLFDVLEHIPDDHAAMKNLHRMVKPDGHLVLSVPAYQWLWGAHDAAHHHQRRYHAATLRALAEQTGWRVQRVSYFNTLLLPLVALNRFGQRLRLDKNKSSDARLPPPWVNRLLQRIFASEAHWLGRHNFPCGVSIVAVLQPQET